MTISGNWVLMLVHGCFSRSCQVHVLQKPLHKAPDVLLEVCGVSKVLDRHHFNSVMTAVLTLELGVSALACGIGAREVGFIPR